MLFTYVKGRNEKTHTIDGYLPDDTVPDSTSNIFVSLEGMYLDVNAQLACIR